MVHFTGKFYVFSSSSVYLCSSELVHAYFGVLTGVSVLHSYLLCYSRYRNVLHNWMKFLGNIVVFVYVYLDVCQGGIVYSYSIVCGLVVNGIQLMGHLK